MFDSVEVVALMELEFGSSDVVFTIAELDSVEVVTLMELDFCSSDVVVKIELAVELDSVEIVI